MSRSMLGKALFVASVSTSTMWMSGAVHAAPAQEPAAASPVRAIGEELEGFTTVVVSHLNRVLGTERLPRANGQLVRPGVFVTLMPERMQIFDRNVATLQQGRPDPMVAEECKSGCPQVLFDAFRQSWLDLGIEAQGLKLEIPTRVLFGADASLPASTLISAAYAAAESRPIQPPELMLLVHSGNAGLRTQAFFLVPPTGLVLPTSSNALGLIIELGDGKYVVTAADRRFGRTVEASSVSEALAVLRDIKKRYAGKETLIIRPGATTSIAELASFIGTVREDFRNIVLGGNQDVSVR